MLKSFSAVEGISVFDTSFNFLYISLFQLAYTTGVILFSIAHDFFIPMP